MSEENNIYNNDNQYSQTDGNAAYDNTQYTQAQDNTAYSSQPEYNPNQTYGSGPVYTVNYGSGKGQGKGLGIASMICGIVSLVGCCGAWYIGIPAALVAIILGIIQIVKNESRGMAIAGIICGAIGLVLTIIVLIVVTTMMANGTYWEIFRELESFSY